MLIFAIDQALPVLRSDSQVIFEYLHELVMAAVRHHAGILIVRFDNDPRHNLTDRGMACEPWFAVGLASRRVNVSDHTPFRWRESTSCRFSASLLFFANEPR